MQRDACQCELWSEVYAEGWHLWEALAPMGDDAEPEFELQKKLIQYHGLISVLGKWEREETREEQPEGTERFRFVLSCGGFPR